MWAKYKLPYLHIFRICYPTGGHHYQKCVWVLLHVGGRNGWFLFFGLFPKLELLSPVTPVPLGLECWNFVFRYSIWRSQSIRDLKRCKQPQLAKSAFEIGRKSRNITCVSHKGEKNGRNLKRSVWAKYKLPYFHIFWEAYPCEGLHLPNALRLIEMPTEETGFCIYRGGTFRFFSEFFFFKAIYYANLLIILTRFLLQTIPLRISQA